VLHSCGYQSLCVPAHVYEDNAAVGAASLTDGKGDRCSGGGICDIADTAGNKACRCMAAYCAAGSYLPCECADGDQVSQEAKQVLMAGIYKAALAGGAYMVGVAVYEVKMGLANLPVGRQGRRGAVFHVVFLRLQRC